MSAYLTITEGNAYFSKRLNADPWEDATNGNKTKALEQATAIIDRLNFAGDKAVDTQELEFPRGTDTVVSSDIKSATAEIALALLDGVDPEIEFENLSMTAHKYGPVQTNYQRNTLQVHTLVGVPSVTAWRFLVPYLRDPQGVALDRIS